MLLPFSPALIRRASPSGVCQHCQLHIPVHIKCITKHKRETPMFLNAMFYRRSDKWELLNIFFFDDPNKAGI